MYAEVTGAQASCFSMDFVAPSVRRFDFNSGASPTQAPAAQDGTPNGYVGVLPTQLSSPAVGYGWVSAAQGFDRGALSSPAYSNLLRDGAWSSSPRDFRMQLPAGTYDVTVTFGDASFARDQMNVTVVTGSVVSDLANVTNVATAAGQFVHRSFKASPDGGELVLRFSDGGGDPYWTVNAVEVRPSTSVKPLSVARAGGNAAQPADGTTDTFTMSNATAGAWYTVSTDMGQVATADADPRYAGVQIQVPESGTFEFTVRRGTAVGTAAVRVEEVNGASRGYATQAYAYAPVRRFDFNGSGADNETGFWNIRGSDVFDPAAGYGWNAAVSEFQRSTAGISEPQLAALYRDGHWQSAPRTFQVGVDPNKTYDVRIHTGDRSFARDELQVTVEGIVAPQSPVATAANEFETITVLSVTPSGDGILDIRIANLGGDPYWVINGIEVAESGQLPDLPEPEAPEESLSRRFDFGTSSSPFDPNFTQVGATNAFDPVLGYGWTTAAPTFNRGITNPLLRDGHWGTNNTFSVQVDQWARRYYVNVTLGDASFARNNISVWAEGSLQHSGLATAAGQFIHRSFSVEVTDGQLNVQIASMGGDPYFTINALEIFETVTAVTVLPEAQNAPADGQTLTAFTVSNVQAGIYTVSIDKGTIHNVDVGTSTNQGDLDTNYAGFQVVVPEDVEEFTVRVKSQTASGTGTLKVERVDGTETGSATLTFQLPTVRRYDFNGSGNDEQGGFTGVRGNQLYNANNGFGWTQAVPEFQRGTTGYSKSSVSLYRDGHWGSAARTFQVAVKQDVDYGVRVYVGDRSFARNLIQVTVEGAAAQIVPSTAANQFAAVTFAGKSTDDGILTVTIVNTGGDPYWVINGMDVWEGGYPHANDPGEALLLAGLWSNEMVGDWLTEAALEAVLPAAREYWVSTGLTDWQMAELYRTPIAIGDLSYRGALGVTKPEGIWLDASGAGLGWHTSLPTPNSQLLTSSYDLLTVLTHELGHVLGHDDLDPHDHPDHIMVGVLQPGTRRVGIAAGGGLGWLAGGESLLLGLGGASGRGEPGRRPADAGHWPADAGCWSIGCSMICCATICG
jgi:fibronectin type 3 domain-containing protein/predicted RNA-binding protein with TRAM domain